MEQDKFKKTGRYAQSREAKEGSCCINIQLLNKLEAEEKRKLEEEAECIRVQNEKRKKKKELEKRKKKKKLMKRKKKGTREEKKKRN